MTRKSPPQKAPENGSWKDRFISVGISYNDEAEIRNWLQGDPHVPTAQFIEDVVENGGSIKITHSSKDGSVFITLAVDSRHPDYGGYMFGLRYVNLAGALVLAQWFYYVVLSSDRGLKYLPSNTQDWLDLS